MRIAVNTRLLLKDKLEGIGWFSYESLKRMTIAHPEHEFIFIFDRPYSEEFIFSDNVTPVVIAPQARHPLLYMIWFELSVTRILKKYKADVFLSTDGYLSLTTKVPSIAVLHDLNFEFYPKDMPKVDLWYYKYFFPKFARKAKRIITVSEYSKSDIHKLYGIDNDIIDVAYNGVKDDYFPVSDVVKVEVKKKYTAGEDYFVFVGALHPRKNLVGLFKAFDFYKNTNSGNAKLVIVGSKQWWTKPIRNAYEDMNFKGDVVFTGHLSSIELNRVLASAIALTYVSYFEGFGIPIVEAFKAETAVITSNVTSMPEVADDAAVLINPFDYKDIAAAMHKVESQSSFRNSLIEKGKERAKLFSWDNTAEVIWESIEKVYK
ncbi:MAG: glycosyltransferase family 4 protein [Bacteroidales bacterium]|nr:glycosyltransferase family 4 protein [Bacteroidales bacterium]